MPAVAFVLLERAEPPDPTVLVRSAATFGHTLVHEPGSSAPSVFAIDGGGSLMVMLIDAPHPDAAHMLAGLAGPSAEDLQRVTAHYILVMQGGPEELRGQDTMLAQLTVTVRASPAVAAMLGHGISFHRADFFADMVEADATRLPLMVCVDVTREPEADERMSFLTHGLVRYGREEFLVSASRHGTGALEFLLAMARWMVLDPSKQLPTGDTVGRTADERIVVQRVPSPLQPGTEVICLDLDT
jgi:hypothetical protein